MTSGSNVERNLARAGELVAQAARAGAELVALPENFALMRDDPPGTPNASAEEIGAGPIVSFLRDAAARHHVVLAGGTFPERIPGDARVYNTSLVLGREGEILARYRKIHLFDVDLPG